MPLPAHMLANPTSPMDAVCSRIRRLGVDAEISRQGNTILIRNLEHPDGDHSVVRRALGIVNDFADTNRLTAEAFVPYVLENFMTDFEAVGFYLVHQVDEESEAGPHVLLRRAPRQ